MELAGRFFKKPGGSFFLFGPRGTGKSTWLKQEMPEAIVIDLLNADTFKRFLSDPELLARVVAGNPQASTIIIDEVQKVPALLDVVHRIVEQGQGRPLQLVLTGSSARKLKRAGVDLLAGRLVLKELHPFMASEIGERFDLERSLRLGMLPLVLGAIDPEETLRSYVALYLREEVMTEALVRNVGSFARFLEAMSFSHGAILNVAEVARECQVNRKTVEGYIEVLEDLLLGYRVPVFSRRAKRRLVQHGKFYYFDAGVQRSVRPRGPLDSPEEARGARLEGLVAQHLRAWISYTGGERRLFYWRTRSGVEVDFVVYGEETFAAIEVKSSRQVSAWDVRGLKIFRKEYPEAAACLLYRGDVRQEIDGIACVPCEEFLRSLVPGTFPGIRPAG